MKLGIAALVVSIAAAMAVAVPAAADAGEDSCQAYPGLPEGSDAHAGMVWIEGGSFMMGSDEHHPEERVTHEVSVDGFWVDVHEVTNAQFARFVEATGYRTLAERTGLSVPSVPSPQAPRASKKTRAKPDLQAWFETGRGAMR
jgi:formylglycine-generating enzyme required for sulfatase activity